MTYGKDVLDTKYIFRLSLKLPSETFFISINIWQAAFKMHTKKHDLHANCTLFLHGFNHNCNNTPEFQMS
jgi:hypothetical protein